MKEKPILFSGEMVKAILENRKTQTRRIIKGLKPRRYHDYCFHETVDGRWELGVVNRCTGDGLCLKYIDCPYGRPGDRLWVRETHWQHPDPRQNFVYYDLTPRIAMSRLYWQTDRPLTSFYHVKSDEEMIEDIVKDGYKKRPSIHMERWVCRLFLEVTAVRVERLQEIWTRNHTFDDLFAEGMSQVGEWDGEGGIPTPLSQFIPLWDKINAKRGYSWESNPYVWVVEFKRVNQ